ncbi:MAG: hypothetical protein JOZ42_05590 [Acetobacteraceae bacterium]|nr:hypothetical protein [Acetobacteraceae bacterium]
MQAAYIICAHQRPDLVSRLVRSLGTSPVAIHIDRKSDMFETVRSGLRDLPNVTFLRRHVCHWGLFGHVRASLEGLAWFLETSSSHACLLTGQCYPLKPPAEIEKELAALDGRSLLEFEAFPKTAWLGWERGGYRRLERFYFRFGRRVPPRSVGLWKRKPPLGLDPHGGASYWCLSRSCAAYATAFLRSHPRVLRFFSSTFVPDEMIFQTILANSPHRHELINAAIHYTYWQPRSSHPSVLTADRLPEVMASGAWFARKFDDHAVLDLVDAYRRRENASFPDAPWRRQTSAA